MDRTKMRRICFHIKIYITLLALALAGSSLGLVALRLSPDARAAADEIELPVLMYHAIMADPGRSGDYVITPEAFRQDLDYIQDAGYETVVMEDVIAYVRSGTPLPEKPIMITFDDGYYNNYLYAWPALRARGMRAVLSVIGVEIDRYTENGEVDETYSQCTWEMLREMTDSGVFELQNHSYDLHHIMRGYMGIGKKGSEAAVAYRTRLYADLERMQSRFQTELGLTPTTFVFPFGCAPPDSRGVLAALGFQATLGTENRTLRLTRDEKSLHMIPRYNRTAAQSARSILENQK